jgi:hypothetical protein
MNKEVATLWIIASRETANLSITISKESLDARMAN